MASPTSIKLDDALKRRIQRLAEQRQRSAHWLMREAIEQYVTHEEARQSFRQDALAAWQHYQETGLHLTGEEVGTWLKTWGTAEEATVPECHE